MDKYFTYTIICKRGVSLKVILKDVNVHYGNNHILKNINLDFCSNKIYSLVGDNGVGKTTLLKCISSIIAPNNGIIDMMQDSSTRYSYNNHKHLKFIRKNISTMIQGYENLYPKLTIKQNIKFFLSIANRQYEQQKLDYYLNLFNLHEHKTKPVSQLSTGTKQKIVLIITLLSESPILIFDEPTIGLDSTSTNALKNELRKLSHKPLIILSSHNLDLVNDIADEVITITDGFCYQSKTS